MKTLIRILPHILTIVLVVGTVPTALAQLKLDDLKKLQEITSRRNVHLERFLASEIKRDVGDEKYYGQVNMDYSTLQNRLEGITKDYNKRKGELDVGSLILKGNHELIKGAIALGFVLAPETGGTSLVISGIGYVADKSLDLVEESYKKAARDEIRRNLRYQLNKVRSELGEDEYQKITSMTDAKEFRAALEERVGAVFGGALGDIPPEEQDVVNAFYTSELANVMKLGFNSLHDVTELQSEQIEANRKEIKNLGRTFYAFAKKTQDQLKGIEQTQREIKNELESLNAKVGKTQQGVEFMQEYLFGKMTPHEQLNALQMGWFPDMSPDQKAEYEAKLKLVTKRQDLIDKTSEFLNGAGTLVKIAGDLGVDPKIVQTAQTAVNVGNQAVAAFAAFSSGNYLACASAVVGMFGLGGRDVAAERHAEVMNMLGTLYSELQGIKGTLEELKAGQQQIMRNQKVILDAIIQLSQQVQVNHQQVMEKLQELQNDVLFNRLLIIAPVSRAYGDCERLVYDMPDPSIRVRVIDTGKNIFPAYDVFKRLHRDFKDPYKNCTRQLQSVRDGSQGFDSFFLLETYKKAGSAEPVDEKSQYYLDNVYRRAWLFYKRDYTFMQKTLPARVSSLFSPMSDVNDLDLKAQEVIEPFTDPTATRFKRPLADLMERPLATYAVRLHAQYVLDYHFYYPLIKDSEDKPYTREELLNLGEDEFRRTGLAVLVEALTMVDMTIAQQTLLSGDMLLPMLAKVFEEQKNSPTDQEKAWHADAEALLANNSILADNFFRYMLRREVLTKSSPIGYAVALNVKDDGLLKKVTNGPWDFQYTDDEKKVEGMTQPKGWSIKFKGKFYALPTAEELVSGELIYQPELYNLLELRSRLLDEINSYGAVDKLSKEKRLEFNQVIINSL